MTSRRSCGLWPTLTFACDNRITAVRLACDWRFALAELGPAATAAPLFASEPDAEADSCSVPDAVA